MLTESKPTELPHWLLAPTIQESILTGDNLGYLALEDCLKPFPDEWEKQQAHFNTLSRSHHATGS